MGNAAKFTESGEIELSLSVEVELDLRVKLCASIRDTGIGMAPENVGTIFEAFNKQTVPVSESMREPDWD